MSICVVHGPRTGARLGTLCSNCGHLNVVHDHRGCAVCAAWHAAEAAVGVDAASALPPTLREQVAEAVGCYCEWRDTPATCPHLTYADAVLAVVADWLAAQPLSTRDVTLRGQRDHDVRLIRDGGAS